jgi:hypothetical protein
MGRYSIGETASAEEQFLIFMVEAWPRLENPPKES